MAGVNVVVSAKTDQGRARDTNEDACSITELSTGAIVAALDTDRTIDVGDRGLLLALSDGMGGHQAGEVASALVLESLQRELARELSAPIDKRLEGAIRRANQIVHEAAQTADRSGMGATLVSVFIRDTQAYIAEIGDSRGYLLRNGRLRQITRDQSMVQLLVEQGVLTPSEARHSRAKNVVLQAVGLAADVRVAIGRLELRRGDRLMLCSDGVTNDITDAELREILVDSRPRMACETMIALANERGGDDNQTVIVCDVLGDLEEPFEHETVTSTLEVLQAFDAKKRDSAPIRVPRVLQPQPQPHPVSDAIPEALPEPVNPVADAIEHNEKQSWIRSLVGKITRDRKR